MKVQQALTVCFVFVVSVMTVTTSRAEVINISSATGDGAESYVRGGSNSPFNYGGEGTVDIRRATAPNDMRKAYMRFDLTSLGNAVVESATLNLHFISLGAGAGNSHTLRLYGLPDVSVDPRPFRDSASSNGGWGEGTANVGTRTQPDDGLINWDRAPSNVTTSNWQFGDGAILLGLFTLQAPGLAEIGQTMLSQGEMTLSQFLSQDTNDRVTFMLSSETVSANASTRFISKEGTQTFGGPAPELSVTPGAPPAVPEPGTIALLVIGCATLLGAKGLRQMKRRCGHVSAAQA